VSVKGRAEEEEDISSITSSTAAVVGSMVCVGVRARVCLNVCVCVYVDGLVGEGVW
jgi:hypothetical protein